MLRNFPGPSAMAAMLAFATRQSREEPMSLHMNAKLPPVFDGRVNWFRYEGAVVDWLSITSVDKPERFGPLLKSRLTADATMYRGLLNIMIILKVLRMELITSCRP